MKFGTLRNLVLKTYQIKTKVILLFGQPGVGKGTYGDLLVKDLEYVKLTPGDLIWNALKNQENLPGVLYKKLKFQVETG